MPFNTWLEMSECRNALTVLSELRGLPLLSTGESLCESRCCYLNEDMQNHRKYACSRAGLEHLEGKGNLILFTYQC